MSRIRIQLAKDPWGDPILKVKDNLNQEYTTRELDLFFHDNRDINVYEMTGQVGEDGRTTPLQLTVMDPPQTFVHTPTFLDSNDIDMLISAMSKAQLLRLVERIQEAAAVDITEELEQ